jgi:hypothetical protein
MTRIYSFTLHGARPGPGHVSPIAAHGRAAGNLAWPSCIELRSIWRLDYLRKQKHRAPTLAPPDAEGDVAEGESIAGYRRHVA